MSTRATEAESVLKEHMGYLPVDRKWSVEEFPARRFRDSCVKPSLRKAERAYMFHRMRSPEPLFELQNRYPKAIFSHETALFLLGEGASPP